MKSLFLDKYNKIISELSLNRFDEVLIPLELYSNFFDLNPLNLDELNLDIIYSDFLNANPDIEDMLNCFSIAKRICGSNVELIEKLNQIKLEIMFLIKSKLKHAKLIKTVELN